MAGQEVNLYGVGDVDLTALMDTVDKQRVTYRGLSLTNVDNDNEPAIAAGSLIEVAGALFKFTSEEAITGWSGISNDTDAYIKIVPAGTSPDTVTAVFTDTAPTWSDAKQGWHGTGGSANHRYVAGVKRGTSSSDYWEKYLIKWQPGDLVTKIIRTEDWNMNGTTFITVAHGLGSKWANIRSLEAIIRNDDDTQRWHFNSFSLGADDVNTQHMYATSTTIRLQHPAVSAYRNVDFDSTSYNRGWVKIEYEA